MNESKLQSHQMIILMTDFKQKVSRGIYITPAWPTFLHNACHGDLQTNSCINTIIIQPSTQGGVRAEEERK